MHLTFPEKIDIIAELIIEGRLYPEVKRTVAKILTNRGINSWNIQEGDYLGEIKAIYDWIRTNVRYLGDPFDNDTIETAPYVLDVRAADCDGYVVLAGAMLASIGYEPILKVSGQTKEEFDHIYLLIGYPPGKSNEFIAFDASIDFGIGWEAPAVIAATYLVFN